jgi:hypothetical protein
MKKVIRLTEADLYRIVKRVISEQGSTDYYYNSYGKLSDKRGPNVKDLMPAKELYPQITNGQYPTSVGPTEMNKLNLWFSTNSLKGKASSGKSNTSSGKQGVVNAGGNVSKPSSNNVSKTQTPSYPVPSDVIFNLQIDGDKVFAYGFKDGKWYTKNLDTGKTANLSDNPRWKQSVEKLKKAFGENPNPTIKPKGITATNTKPDFLPRKIDLKPTDNSSSTPGMEEPELGLGGRMFK